METPGKNKASSSSLSSSIQPKFKYDVFLSFRGKDTRKGFTSHLFNALVRHGFHTFRDDNELERGERVDFGLLKAIMESRISVVILSKNYAESKWCLDELVKIMECRKTLQQIVLPIFYDVEPSEVRAQKGSLKKAFVKHEKEVSDGKVDKWREALTEVANLSGWDVPNVSNGDEANSLQKVVEEVWNKLAPRLHVAFHEVGLESRLQELMSLLDMESNCVRIVAIWGMGGIGKTTIAKKLYNHIQYQFDGSSFLANIREISKEGNGPVSLQRQLLSDIFRSGNHKLSNSDQGIEVLKQRAFCRKVLLILDDVDDYKQLDNLGIRRDFFGPGSRIIITTRDISSVNFLGVDEKYVAKELNENESLELFCGYCLKEVHPTQEHLDLSTQVVKCVGGLPLALEVLGTFLCGKKISQWRSAVAKLSKIPHHDVQGKLRISIDSLSPEVKNLFLDMACFFVGRNRDFTVKILEGCKFTAEIDIQILADRCLIKDEGGRLVMHDILRDIGREIVRQESEDPEKRSRLWYIDDVLDVLMGVTEGTEVVKGLVKATDVQENALQVMGDGKGTEAVEGCRHQCLLNFTNPIGVQVNGKAFEKMNNLWLLRLDYVHMTAGYEHISKRLLWLRWKGFPLESMPWNLSMVKLVALDLRYSKLRRVWDGKKVLDKLKFLYLGHCHYLTETPDFSGLKNLEELFLNDCTRLVNVSESIGHLNKLLVLDMKNCKKLRKVPSSIWTLKTLKSLDLSGCSMLGNFSEFHGSLSKYMFSSFSSWIFKTKRAESIGLSPSHVLSSGCLKELRMIDCNLSCLPNEVGNLISLEILDLSKNNFCTLPDRIYHLTRLKELRIEDCNLSCLPNEVGNLISLESLHLDRNNLLTLPDSFCNLACLENLTLSDCKLSHLPDRFGMLSSLERLCLNGTNLRSLPSSCSDLARMQFLIVANCERLQSLPKLPVNLWSLFAPGCTSLQSIPTEFNCPDGLSMDFDGCNMLAKGNFANNLMERIGQSLSESSQCNRNINLSLPGDEVPSWFKYQSIGSRLSLVVPRTRRIRGFCLCIVVHIIDTWAHVRLRVSVNKSPPFRVMVTENPQPRGEDRMCIVYVRSDSRGIYFARNSYPGGINCGEELEIAINLNERDEGKVWVKKCGINFIYEGDEADTEMPDENDTEMPISKKRKIIEEE